MNQCDIYNELLKDFEARDLNKFKKSLKVFNKTVIHSNDLVVNIFEKVLSTAGCNKFVEACVLAGFDVNYVNIKLNKAAINYAVESLDYKNITALQLWAKGTVNFNHQYESETALISLCKNLCPENVENSSLCIGKLTRFGASPNITDGEDKTPLYYVLQNKQIPTRKINFIVCRLLASRELDEKEYLLGLDFVLQNGPDGKCNSIYYALIRHILSLSTLDFLKSLTYWQRDIRNWNNKKIQNILLQEFSNQRQESVLKALLNLIKINTEEEKLCLLSEAIKHCNWKIALHLLKICRLSEDIRLKLQKLTIRKFDVRECNTEDYESCLHVLIKEDASRLELLMDTSIKVQNNLAKHVLLRHGAKFKGEHYDIRNIDAEVLEEHFNNCITSNSDLLTKKAIHLQLNFKNFINEQNEIDMDPIFQLAQEKKLRSLLQHPLIDSLLQLNWMRFRNIYYIHFFILIILNFALATQVFLRFPERNSFDYRIWLMNIFCTGIVFFLFIELILSYFMARAFPKLRDILLIVLLSLTCLEIGNSEFQRVVAIFAIMLMALKLIVLIGALPFTSLSTHMLMLEEVTSTFASCIAQYSIFLLIYALCFYVLFSKANKFNVNSSHNQFPNLNQTITQAKVNTTVVDPFLTLYNLYTTFPKTLTMFFGQYDVQNDFYSYGSTWILILFMFMAMILTNLLSALAISDTQTIQSQAEINGAICRVNLLKKYRAAVNVPWGQIPWLRRVLFNLVNLNECPFDMLDIYHRSDKEKLQTTFNYEISDCLNTNRKCYLHSGGFKFNEVVIKKGQEILKKNLLRLVKQLNEESFKYQFQKISTSLQEQFYSRFEQIQNKQDHVEKKLSSIQEHSSEMSSNFPKTSEFFKNQICSLEKQVDNRLSVIHKQCTTIQNTQELIENKFALIQEQSDKRFEKLSKKLQERLDNIIALMSSKSNST